DGFEVRGARTYPGGVTLSSWGDHRIFMSLFVAGMRMQSANWFSGFEDVRLSFPTFMEEFAKAGVRTKAVEEENGQRDAQDDAPALPPASPAQEVPSAPAPRLRANVSGLPRYLPGRAAPSALVDKLSSNENPYPPLPSVVASMRKDLGHVNRYPD